MVKLPFTRKTCNIAFALGQVANRSLAPRALDSTPSGDRLRRHRLASVLHRRFPHEYVHCIPVTPQVWRRGLTSARRQGCDRVKELHVVAVACSHAVSVTADATKPMFARLSGPSRYVPVVIWSPCQTVQLNETAPFPTGSRSRSTAGSLYSSSYAQLVSSSNHHQAPRSFCSHCLKSWLQQGSQQPDIHSTSRAFALERRLYHSLMNSPATTAAEAPSLANLQGLLHVYKQSLDSVGSAVEQLRHTLVPFDEEELHEEDAGRFASGCTWFSHQFCFHISTMIYMLHCHQPKQQHATSAGIGFVCACCARCDQAAHVHCLAADMTFRV